MNPLTLKPVLSEQTYALAEQRVYVFTVLKAANKLTIAQAVASQFSVKVERVNVANRKGKVMRTLSITGRRRGNSGVRRDVKKAYVTLAKGSSLPFFAAVEEAAKKEQTAQDKVDRAVERQNQVKAKANEAGVRRLRLFKKQGDK